jgi:hypothetical protein
MLVCAVALIWLSWFGRVENAKVPPMEDAERLGWFFLTIPLAGYVAAVVATNAFVNRYFVGTLPGVSLAIACALWRRFRRTPRIGAGIILIAFLLSLFAQLRVTVDPSRVRPPTAQDGPDKLRELMSLESTILKDGKTTIVSSADRILGVEAIYYSKNPNLYALLLTGDMRVVARSHRNLAVYHPLRFWNIDDVRIHARDTALVDPPDEMIAALTRAGLSMRILPSKFITLFYLDSRSSSKTSPE